LTALGVGEAFVSVLDDAGIPTKVERVSIIPPASRGEPISGMERQAVMDGSKLRQRYGGEMPEAEAIHAFHNRMRRQRGIPEEAFKGGWTQGDFRQFMPNFKGIWPGGRRSATWSAMGVWSTISACCILLVETILN
jgi:uncharacterized protein